MSIFNPTHSDRAALLWMLEAEVCCGCGVRFGVVEWTTSIGDLELYCGSCALAILHRLPAIAAARRLA